MSGLELYKENIYSFVKMLGEYGDLLELPSGSVAAFSGTPFQDENWALFLSGCDMDEVETVKDFFATYGVDFIAPHNPGTARVMLNAFEKCDLTVQKHYAAMQVFNPRERKRYTMPSAEPALGAAHQSGIRDTYGDIVKVENDIMFFNWCEAMWRGFSDEGDLSQGYYDMLCYLHSKSENEFYAITIGVEIIGTAMFHKTHLGRGLYYFSIVPEHRREGYATRFLDGLIATTDCAKQQKLVLLSTEEGRLFYNNYGFDLINEIPVRALRGTIIEEDL